MKKTMLFAEVCALLRPFEDRLFPASSLPPEATVEVSSARAGLEGGGCDYLIVVKCRPAPTPEVYAEFAATAEAHYQLKLGLTDDRH